MSCRCFTSIIVRVLQVMVAGYDAAMYSARRRIIPASQTSYHVKRASIGGIIMKELFTMWKYNNMVVLVALSAAMYAAVLIPFQSVPIIPGHTSLRIANVLPVALGLFFGPAGAWGAGIGNL